jgi:hypothetical protein
MLFFAGRTVSPQVKDPVKLSVFREASGRRLSNIHPVPFDRPHVWHIDAPDGQVNAFSASLNFCAWAARTSDFSIVPVCARKGTPACRGITW